MTTVVSDSGPFIHLATGSVLNVEMATFIPPVQRRIG
jgi:hypothetical protein